MTRSRSQHRPGAQARAPMVGRTQFGVAVAVIVAAAVAACGSSAGSPTTGEGATQAATPTRIAVSTPRPTPALPSPTACPRVVVATERSDALPSTPVPPSAVRATIATPAGAQGFAHDATTLWVMTHRTDDVYRVDPSTSRATAISYTTHALDSGGFDLSAGPDGVFLVVGRDDVVDRVDTATNTLTTFATIRGAATVSDSPLGLWVGSSTDDGQLVRQLDPATGRVLRSVAVGGEGDLTYDVLMIRAAAGSLWVAPQDRPVLFRIDPAAGRVTAVVSLPVAAATLAGSSTAVYVGLGDNSVGRVDAATGCLTAATAVGPKPGSTGYILIPIDVDAAGHVRASYGDGAWVTLEPTTLAVLHAYRVDTQDSEGGITSAFGSLWFSTFGTNTIVRLAVVDVP